MVLDESPGKRGGRGEGGEGVMYIQIKYLTH